MKWMREMADLFRQYWEADRAYRGALRQIKKAIKEKARG